MLNFKSRPLLFYRFDCFREKASNSRNKFVFVLESQSQLIKFFSFKYRSCQTHYWMRIRKSLESTYRIRRIGKNSIITAGTPFL